MNTPRLLVKLGTRASALAKWQANWVAGLLRQTGVQVEMVLITTQGDATTGPLEATGSEGLFTKEIQRALLDGHVDLAVHSLKDLPTDSVEGLCLAAVPARASSNDVLVSNKANRFDQLDPEARVGTGSMRRRAQLLHTRSDLQVMGIRGNVDTRLKQLDEDRFDAIILAEAGLRRLGLEDRITEVLPRSWMLPAVGQGALGLETRDNDPSVLAALDPLNDPDTHHCVLAERSMLAAVHGGCLAPIGAWTEVKNQRLTLDAVALSPDGRERIACHKEGETGDAETIGRLAAEELLEQGAGRLIEAARDAQA